MKHIISKTLHCLSKKDLDEIVRKTENFAANSLYALGVDIDSIRSNNCVKFDKSKNACILRREINVQDFIKTINKCKIQCTTPMNVLERYEILENVFGNCGVN